MSTSNTDYPCKAPFTWDCMQDTLKQGGLGFWRLMRDANDHIIFESDDTLLALLKIQQTDMPCLLDEVLEKYFAPEDTAILSEVLDNCLMGKCDTFNVESRLLDTDNKETHVRIFGNIIHKDAVGRALLITGCTQNIQALHEIKEALKLALKENKITAKRTRMMLDAMPLACDFWDTNPQNITTDKAIGPLPELQGEYAYLTDANQAALNLFGLPDKQAYLDSFNQLSPEFQPDGRSAWQAVPELVNSAIRDGSVSFEWLHQTIDGTPLPCEITLMSIPYGDGQTVISYKHDLRASKAAEAKLNAALLENKIAAERTRIMLDSLPIACNFWNTTPANASIIEQAASNPTLAAYSSYLQDTNKTALTLFSIEDKQTYLNIFHTLSPELQANGRSTIDVITEMTERVNREETVTFDWMHQKLDGTLIPCEITLIRVPFGDGVTVVSYTRDLRELKAAQSAIMMERLLLKRIMDSTPICFTITVNDIIKFITPFAQQFLGCNIDDAIQTIFTKKETYEKLKTKHEQDELIAWQTVSIRRPDGSTHTMLLNSFKTDYYGEAGVMSWFIDITEMRQKNRELQHAKKVAEENAQAKSNFLANMSHEIRTPMNAVLGLLHLLMQTSPNEVQHEYLSKTESAAKALLRIINDILDFSKIEADKLEMEKEVFNLTKVLQNVTDLTNADIYKKDLEYIVSMQEDTPLGLIGDQIRLAQILTNLVSNATKFTEHGEILLKITIVSESPTDITLQFLVQDSGIGLTEEQASTLFSAFTQADASTTRRYGGTGLGLVICKRLVEMMDGTIWVESTFGQGSTFGFTANFELHNETLKQTITVNKDFKNFSALVIDDNAVALEYLSVFLKNIGLQVETAISGADALQILADWTEQDKYFDLIFTDWKMPEMDGIETANRIAALLPPSKMPVMIMLTAYSRDELLGLIKENTIKTVMTKPLSPSVIVNVLNDILWGNLPVIEKEVKGNKGLEYTIVKDFVGANILLAEDNEINQLMASQILTNAGLNVDIANNGIEAIEMTKTGKYELILMDIQMPEMDGITATHKIRSMEEFKKLPILAMTANAMSGDKEMSLRAGMNDHISKPINLQEMFSILAKWLKVGREQQKK